MRRTAAQVRGLYRRHENLTDIRPDHLITTVQQHHAPCTIVAGYIRTAMEGVRSPTRFGLILYIYTTIWTLFSIYSVFLHTREVYAGSHCRN